jgi:hypothetical protein
MIGEAIPSVAFASAPIKSFSVSKNAAMVKFRARSASVDRLSLKITIRTANATHRIPNRNAVSIMPP